MIYNVSFEKDEAKEVLGLLKQYKTCLSNTSRADLDEAIRTLEKYGGNGEVAMQKEEAEAITTALSVFGINADQFDVAITVHDRLLKLIAPSDVPRFLNTLRDMGVPAYAGSPHMKTIFKYWTETEGLGMIAEEFMDLIKETQDMNLIKLWDWVCTNNPCPYTTLEDEVERYEQALNA